MNTKILLALLVLCGTLIGCGEDNPIIDNTDPDTTITDSVPDNNQNDTVPEKTPDPNLEKALKLDSTFVRERMGTAYGKDLAEISGMVCSRVTPGYLWVQGDDSYKVRAMTPEGKFSTTIRLHDSYRDWEGLSGGVYNDTNYLFVGVFGDNDLRYKDKYYIYYFEEPEVVEGEVKVEKKIIHFGYTDRKAHNAEVIMYDNIENKIYIVDKWNTFNSTGMVYSMPFSSEMNLDTMHVLTEECQLGGSNMYVAVGDVAVLFQNPTGGDITPDGKTIMIKNERFMLIWEREMVDGQYESVGTTLARMPKQVTAYKKEPQGEAIAWLDNTTCYTTSDVYSDGSAPIWKYTRTLESAE
jgi:hypothetical protein